MSLQNIMYLYQPITITFTYEERRRIQELTNYFKLEKESKYLGQAQLFKQTLMGYLTSVNDKHHINQQVKKLLKQKRIQVESKEKLANSHYQTVSGLRQLKKYIKEKQNDSDCYTFYVSFMNQLKDLNSQNLAAVQANIRKATAINPFEKDNIYWVARKIVKQNQNEQKIQNSEAISKFLTQILRYGFYQQIISLQQITDKTLLQKCQALIKNIQNNYIEIQSTYRFGSDNPFRQFIEKLCNGIYKREDLQKIIQKMPPKLQRIMEPLLKYVIRLRQNSGQILRPSYSTTSVMYQNYQIKKAQQQSIEQLIADFSRANKKNDKLQAEINDLKRFIISVSSLSASSKQEKEVHKQIGGYISNYQEQELRYSLLKIYQKFNNYGYKQPAHKTFRQNRENELVYEKLNKKLLRLQEDNAKYREEIKQLEQHKTESLDERIQLLNSIEQYKQEIENKNTKISKLQRTILSLQKIKEQKAELENVIKLLQQRDQQKSVYLANENQKNKEHKEKINILTRQKQELIEFNSTLMREFQSLKQQLQQKRQKDSIAYQTQISQQVAENYRNGQVQKLAFEKQNNRLNNRIAELQLENQQVNAKLNEVEDLKKVVQELNKQNDILSEKLQIYIRARGAGSEKDNILNCQHEDLLAQIETLKRQIQILTHNELQTKERQQQCERELDNLKDLFHGLSKQQQEKEKVIKQLAHQNQNLKKQIVEITDYRDNNQMRQQYSRQNKTLQNELEQARKLNGLIKTQYMNFKQESKNAYKAKLEEDLLKFKENQQKLRESYRKLHELYLSQKEKMAALKTENQQLKKVKSQSPSKQLISLKYLTQKSDLQQKHKDLLQKYQSLKTFSERQLIKKQQQIANLKLQLIRSERNSQSGQEKHQRQIIQQKLYYLQGQIQELQGQNSRMRMELERREQQILILKTQAIK